MGFRDLIEPINLKNWLLKSVDIQESVKRDFQYFHVISKTNNFGTLQLETLSVNAVWALLSFVLCVKLYFCDFCIINKDGINK